MGKVTIVSIHPNQIPIGGCKTNSYLITIPIQSKFGIGSPEVVDEYIIVTTIKSNRIRIYAVKFTIVFMSVVI